MSAEPAGWLRGVATEVRCSTGTAPPDHALPPGATDCHHHIFDPRFPRPRGRRPEDETTVDDHLAFRRRLGLSRSVVIGSFLSGTDNAALLHDVGALGDSARGVAIARADVASGDLDRLHAGGVRGLRLSLDPHRAPTPEDMTALARRAADRGWHLDLAAARTGHRLAAWEPLLAALPCKLVIDHFGYPADPSDPDDPSVLALLRLIDGGRTHAKLSGVYIRSQDGFPDYADMDGLARRLIAARPERVLWGSDWPHVGPEARPKPDAARLVDRVTRWAPDPVQRRRILADNPDALYWTA